LQLPVINLAALFIDFAGQPVVLIELPTGAWSSPISDTVMLAKIAKCLKPRRVLEIGSFRGYTAKLLAEHTGPETRIVAFDRYPEHGEAYRDTAIAEKIDRRVGSVSDAAFAQDGPGSYDLIFIDADHSYDAVKHDTQVMLPLLAPEGMMVWHDYANWGRFSKKNGVPEALHELAQTLPVLAVGGSWLAVYSPVWSTVLGADRLTQARQASLADLPGDDPWTTMDLR